MPEVDWNIVVLSVDLIWAGIVSCIVIEEGRLDTKTMTNVIVLSPFEAFSFSLAR